MKIIKSLGSFDSLDNIRTWLLSVSKAFQGGISFGSSFLADNFAASYNQAPTANIDPDINIRCYKASGTTPSTANATFTISTTSAFFKDQHVPIGVIVVSVDAAAIIYTVTIATWTKGSV